MRTALRVFIVTGLVAIAVLVVAISRAIRKLPPDAFDGCDDLAWWRKHAKTARVNVEAWKWTQRQKAKGWYNPKL